MNRSRVRMVGVAIVLVTIAFGAYRAIRELRSYYNEDAAVCKEGSLTANAAFGDPYFKPLAESFVQLKADCVAPRLIQVFDPSRDTAAFFYDKAKIAECRVPAGDDDMSEKNGIDTASIFFYVGHGDTTSWWTQRPPGASEASVATTQCMCIGNPREGRLRYFFQAACQVFAHGPMIIRNNYVEYSAPGDFTGAGDDANVFNRWAGALGAGLRLACGGSTHLVAGASEIEALWTSKKASFDVSDSFLVAMHSKSGYVPLCISRGSGRFDVEAQREVSDPMRSGLFDQVFTQEPNPFGQGDFFYIEYVEELGTVPLPILAPLVDELEGLAIRSLTPDSPVSPWSRVLKMLGSAPGSPQLSDREHTLVFHDRRVANGVRRANCPSTKGCLSDGDYVKEARQFVNKVGWNEPDAGPAVGGVRLKVDSYRLGGSGPGSCPLLTSNPICAKDHPEHFEKGAVVMFKRHVRTKTGKEFYQAGLDGTIMVQLNYEGTPVSAWKRWSKVVGGAGQFSLNQKALKDATRSANEQLAGLADEYTLGPPTIIYRRVDSRLQPFFAFEAEVRERKALLRFPPRRIEIAAPAMR